MFRKILVPLDCSPLSEQALPRAESIARAAEADLDLMLIHQPITAEGLIDTPWNDQARKEQETYLGELAAEITAGAAVATSHAVLTGDVVDGICERARQISADLIVMTSHGRTGFSRLWMGSVADGVIRRSAVPVLMLPAIPQATRSARRAQAATTATAPVHAPEPFRRILVPFDGSAIAVSVLAAARDLARCGGGTMVLLHVVQPIPRPEFDPMVPFSYATPIPDEIATARVAEHAERDLANVAQAFGHQGVEVQHRVVISPNPPLAIIEAAAAETADVIAMTSHGRGASRLLIGSVADKVIHGAGLPMLIVRPLGR